MYNMPPPTPPAPLAAVPHAEAYGEVLLLFYTQKRERARRLRRCDGALRAWRAGTKGSTKQLSLLLRVRVVLLGGTHFRLVLAAGYGDDERAAIIPAVPAAGRGDGPAADVPAVSAAGNDSGRLF